MRRKELFVSDATIGSETEIALQYANGINNERKRAVKIRIRVARRGSMVSLQNVDVLQHPLCDSTIWDDFRFRSNDVVIATYSKTGTTWTQQIVGQILLGPDPNLRVADVSPWLDFRPSPKREKLEALEAQEHRRFIKTHLPVHALRMSDDVKYIYIARDGRDTCWSLHNHFFHFTTETYARINDAPDRVGPPIERPSANIRQYFLEWLNKDGYPFWSFWAHIRGWWRIRDRTNVKMIHFSELKHDLPKMMKEIAAFLGADVDPAHWQDIELYCSFDWMKTNAARVAPREGKSWEGGAQTFIHRGVNGRWRDVLTDADVKAYEERAVAELGAECAAWLAQR